jgi:hypothetical protein
MAVDRAAHRRRKAGFPARRDRALSDTAAPYQTRPAWPFVPVGTGEVAGDRAALH